MAYTSYPSVAGTSLVSGGSSIAEEYIPLWVYSSGYCQITNESSGGSFLNKGTAGQNPAKSLASNLYTLNANWSPAQKYALEASFLSSVTSNTAYIALWDMISNAIVSASQISTTSTTITLIRSGAFTLIPGHVYGVTGWNTTGQVQFSKAHLVALIM